MSLSGFPCEELNSCVFTLETKNILLIISFSFSLLLSFTVLNYTNTSVKKIIKSCIYSMMELGRPKE